MQNLNLRELLCSSILEKMSATALSLLSLYYIEEVMQRAYCYAKEFYKEKTHEATFLL